MDRQLGGRRRREQRAEEGRGAERRAEGRVETHARCLPPQSLASQGQETFETELPLPPPCPPIIQHVCHTLLPFLHLSAEHFRDSVRGAISPSRGKAVTPPQKLRGGGAACVCVCVAGGEDGDVGKRTPTFRPYSLSGYSAPTSSSPPPPPPPPAPPAAAPEPPATAAPRRNRSQRRGWGRRWRQQWGLQSALEPGAGARAGGSSQLRGVEPQRQEIEGISQDRGSWARPFRHGAGR